MKRTDLTDTMEVFRRLGLGREVDRQQIRQLAELGRETARESQPTLICAETRNNTAKDNNDAELESAS